MLKNNRPYTIENGWEDNDLINNLNEEEIKIVGEWIKKNIRKSNKIFLRSSYGLKHTLEDDTGIYLTNNQFKDAMLLAGYKPVDENELNWRYRIKIAKDKNPNPFIKWLIQYEKERSALGDFARDALNDDDFPVFAEHDVIENYLMDVGCCAGASRAFEELWKEYEVCNE